MLFIGTCKACTGMDPVFAKLRAKESQTMLG